MGVGDEVAQLPYSFTLQIKRATTDLDVFNFRYFTITFPPFYML